MPNQKLGRGTHDSTTAGESDQAGEMEYNNNAPLVKAGIGKYD